MEGSAFALLFLSLRVSALTSFEALRGFFEFEASGLG